MQIVRKNSEPLVYEWSMYVKFIVVCMVHILEMHASLKAILPHEMFFKT